VPLLPTLAFFFYAMCPRVQISGKVPGHPVQSGRAGLTNRCGAGACQLKGVLEYQVIDTSQLLTVVRHSVNI